MRSCDKPIQVGKPELARLDNGEWLCQPKWDGFRALCRRERYGWKVYPRKPGRPPLKVDRQILTDLSKIDVPVGTVLDGELLTPRRTRQYTEPERVIIYGVLYIGKEWVGGKPESWRLEWVSELNLTGRISLIETAYTGFAGFYETTKKNPLLEGVVLKRRDAQLVGSETSNRLNKAWLKVKWRGRPARSTEDSRITRRDLT